MPDEPTKKPFSQQLTAALPSSEAAAKSGASAPSEPPKPVATAPATLATPSSKAATTATSQPEADDDIMAGKRAPKGEDFKRVKHAAAEANKRADELKAKHEAAEKRLAELDRVPKHNAELIKKIEAERDELKAKWQTVEAQYDPGFHAKYDNQIGEAVGKIKDAVPADRLNDLAQVMQMPDGDRKRKILAELTEDMDPPTVTDIMIANREIRDILAARKKELENSGAILKSSAEQRQKQQEERKSAYAKSFDDVLAKAQAKDGDAASPLYQRREGDDDETRAWNAGIAERSAVARKAHFDEFDSAEDKAEFALNAAAYPAALQTIKELQTQLAAVEETVAKMQGTSPGLSAGAKGSAGQKLTFTQRMQQVVQ